MHVTPEIDLGYGCVGDVRKRQATINLSANKLLSAVKFRENGFAIERSSDSPFGDRQGSMDDENFLHLIYCR